MRHPVQCTYLPQTSVGHAVCKKQIIKLYIYKCTELRFYHKANNDIKATKNHTRLPWWTNKKEKCEKRKNNAPKKTDEWYDI